MGKLLNFALNKLSNIIYSMKFFYLEEFFVIILYFDLIILKTFKKIA